MLPFELRSIFPLILLVFPAFAEWTLYTCMATTKGYVVGAKLNSSGLARRSAPGKWEQISHNHPFMFDNEADFAGTIIPSGLNRTPEADLQSYQQYRVRYGDAEAWITNGFNTYHGKFSELAKLP